MIDLEARISSEIDFLVHSRRVTNNKTLQHLVKSNISEYFERLNPEEKEAFEKVVIKEYLSRPLPIESNPESKEDYESIMFGLCIFSAVAEGKPKPDDEMERTTMPHVLQKIYEILYADGINTQNKMHKNIVEYASLVLTWHAPFDESYRAIERHLNGPLFYELFADLVQINPMKAAGIKTTAGPDKRLIRYPDVTEAPFKDGTYTSAAVYDFLIEDAA